MKYATWKRSILYECKSLFNAAFELLSFKYYSFEKQFYLYVGRCLNIIIKNNKINNLISNEKELYANNLLSPHEQKILQLVLTNA